VIAMMQTFDPPGICAANLKECLLIQLKLLGIDDPLVTALIQHHLKDLENKRYKVIAKALKTDIGQIVAAVNVIRCLDPKPGERFSGDEPVYITPDVYVLRKTVTSSWSSTTMISPGFRSIPTTAEPSGEGKKSRKTPKPISKIACAPRNGSSKASITAEKQFTMSCPASSNFNGIFSNTGSRTSSPWCSETSPKTSTCMNPPSAG
jgi:hypothetical protein